MKTITHIPSPEILGRCLKSITTGLFLLLVLPLSAQIIYQGANNGVIFQNVAISNSSASWTSVQNAQYPDGILTTSGPLSVSGSFTDYLMATQFYFTISAGYTISGIEVVFTRNSTKLPQTHDYLVQIVKNGVISSYDHSNNTPWQAQSNPATYGGNGDLWGETWAPADINSSGFGVAIAVKKKGGAGQDLTAFIDNMQIKVYYYDASGNIYYSGTSGSSLKIASLTGIVSHEQLPGFLVFPNPSDGSSLSIKFEEPLPCDVLVVLYDILGREEYAKVAIMANSSFVEAIGCNKRLTPGTYLITATNREKTYKQMIVVK